MRVATVAVGLCVNVVRSMYAVEIASDVARHTWMNTSKEEWK